MVLSGTFPQGCGCGDDDPPAGSLGGSCYPNDTCDDELTCVDGTCEARGDAGPDDGSGDGSAGGAGDGDGDAGDNHACAILDNDAIECWGSAAQTASPAGAFAEVWTQFGLSCGRALTGELSCRDTDVDGSTTPPSGTFQDLAVGANHGCAIGDDSTIACWGYNVDGQTEAPAGSFVEVVAAGGISCARDADGSMQCWGQYDGPAPEQVFTQITAGNALCGIVAGGAAECWGTAGIEPGYDVRLSACWGNNSNGRATPPTGTFLDLAVGPFHSCASRTDDTLVCWGGNDQGQADAPAGTFKTVDTGWTYSCGIRLDDSVECWGATDDSTFTNTPSDFP